MSIPMSIRVALAAILVGTVAFAHSSRHNRIDGPAPRLRSGEREFRRLPT